MTIAINLRRRGHVNTQPFAVYRLHSCVSKGWMFCCLWLKVSLFR